MGGPRTIGPTFLEGEELGERTVVNEGRHLGHFLQVVGPGRTVCCGVHGRPCRCRYKQVREFVREVRLDIRPQVLVDVPVECHGYTVELASDLGAHDRRTME
jgi:hypothetical protein